MEGLLQEELVLTKATKSRAGVQQTSTMYLCLAYIIAQDQLDWLTSSHTDHIVYHECHEGIMSSNV